MKITTLVSLFTILIITSNAWAVEPITDQQATFYYQIPFGGVQKSDNTHKFGFRVDRVTIDRTTGQYSNSVSFNDLMKKPASLDFQMGYKGMAAFKMHGYDYLPQLISKADEEDSENSDAGAENQENGQKNENGEAEETDKKKVLKYSDVFDQTTVGILIGGVIAIFALAGTGG